MENGLWGNQDVLLHLRRVFSSAEDPSDDAGKTKADHIGRGRTRGRLLVLRLVTLAAFLTSCGAVDSVAQLWGRELKSSNMLETGIVWIHMIAFQGSSCFLVLWGVGTWVVLHMLHISIEGDLTSPKMPEVGRAVAKFAETYHAAHAKRCSGQLLRGNIFKQRLMTKPRGPRVMIMILE